MKKRILVVDDEPEITFMVKLTRSNQEFSLLTGSGSQVELRT